VVLATCRRPERLARTLRTLFAQTYPKLEVLVVDNCPAQPGAAEAVAALDDPRVRLLQEPRPGASRARNLGLSAARGELVAFTDDDVDADPDWLGNLVVPFLEDATLGCVTGLILPAQLDTEAEWRFEQYGGFGKGYLPRTFAVDDEGHGPLYPYNAGLFGSGASAAFRRELITELGGFAEDLGPATAARGGEDLDVYLTVLLAGHRLRYEPAAVVWHELRQDAAHLTRQVHSYGIGLSAMITKRVLASAQERRAVLRAVPAAVRYVLASDSPKNAGRERDYPKRLVGYELAGLVYGPVAYLRSRRHDRGARPQS
jgi:GT2 family glycosyltransferase